MRDCLPSSVHLLRLTSCPCSWATMSWFTMSDTVLTISSAWLNCGPATWIIEREPSSKSKLMLFNKTGVFIIVHPQEFATGLAIHVCTSHARFVDLMRVWEGSTLDRFRQRIANYRGHAIVNCLMSNPYVIMRRRPICT